MTHTAAGSVTSRPHDVGLFRPDRVECSATFEVAAGPLASTPTRVRAPCRRRPRHRPCACTNNASSWWRNQMGTVYGQPSRRGVRSSAGVCVRRDEYWWRDEEAVVGDDGAGERRDGEDGEADRVAPRRRGRRRRRAAAGRRPGRRCSRLRSGRRLGHRRSESRRLRRTSGRRRVVVPWPMPRRATATTRWRRRWMWRARRSRRRGRGGPGGRVGPGHAFRRRGGTPRGRRPGWRR